MLKGTFSRTGPVIFGFVSSACWIGPALALGLGASTLGAAGSFIAPYRPYFVTLALVSLAWTFYRAFRPKLRMAQGKGVLSILAALRPTRREAPVFVMAAVVMALVLFPYWWAPLFLN